MKKQFTMSMYFKQEDMYADMMKYIRELEDKLDVRHCVLEFAKDMERKLRDNDYKSGWQDLSLSDFERRIDEEIDEVWNEVDWDNTNYPEDLSSMTKQSLIDELADVANFCMMLADRLRTKQNNKG